MRIGINASFMRKPATGIGQVTVHFLEELSKLIDSRAEYDSIECIVYLEEEMPSSIRLSDKVRVESFLPLFWKRDDLIRKVVWEKYSLPQRAKRDGCDVFLSLYQSATIMPKTMKHYMVVHDIIPKLFPEYLNNIRKKIYQSLIENAIDHADKVVAVSSHTKKDLIKHLGISPEKISVNYIDVDPIFRKTVSPEKSREVMEWYQLQSGYIYSGGGLEKRKNIERTLRAYKRLVDRAKQEGVLGSLPKLVISGKLMPKLAPLITDIELLVKEMNLSERVHILDFVPQEDLPALYANATVFVFPSLYEGFGMPVLEAMCQKTIVVTSKTTSLPEVGGDAVVYCDPESVEDIADSMRKAISDPDLRETLLHRMDSALQNFSWEKFVQKMLQMILQK